jgi:hypothetical protein
MNEPPLLNEHVPRETRLRIIFERDRAPPYFGHQVTVSLNQRYGNRWLGGSGPMTDEISEPNLPSFLFTGVLQGASMNRAILKTLGTVNYCIYLVLTNASTVYT